jgi:hypothetical protein
VATTSHGATADFQRAAHLADQARKVGTTLRASGNDLDRLAGWLLKELADMTERLADDAYVREHGNDDLETGHLRDPKGDEAAHGCTGGRFPEPPAGADLGQAVTPDVSSAIVASLRTAGPQPPAHDPEWI